MICRCESAGSIPAQVSGDVVAWSSLPCRLVFLCRLWRSHYGYQDSRTGTAVCRNSRRCRLTQRYLRRSCEPAVCCLPDRAGSRPPRRQAHVEVFAGPGLARPAGQVTRLLMDRSIDRRVPELNRQRRKRALYPRKQHRGFLNHPAVVPVRCACLSPGAAAPGDRHLAPRASRTPVIRAVRSLSQGATLKCSNNAWIGWRSLVSLKRAVWLRHE